MLRPTLTLVAVSIVSIVVLFIATHTAHWGASGRSVRLSVNEHTLKARESFTGNEVTHSFRVTNDSSDSVLIEGFRYSCKCTKIDPTTVTIPPHASQLFTARIQIPETLDANELRIHVRPVVNSGMRPDAWTLRVPVRPIAQIESADIDLGVFVTDSRLEDMAPTISRITVDPSVNSIHAEMPSEFFFVHTAKGSTSGTFEVHFDPRTTLFKRLGRLQDTLRIVAASSDGKRIGSQHFPIRWRVAESVYSNPSSISLGIRQIGDSVTSDVTVVSTIGEIKDVGMLGESDDVLVRSSELGNRTNARLSVKHTIRHSGNWRDELNIAATVGDGHTRIISIPISYYGIK